MAKRYTTVIFPVEMIIFREDNGIAHEVSSEHGFSWLLD